MSTTPGPSPASKNLEVCHPDKVANTGAYSAGIIRDGWLYVSGQGPVDYKTGQPTRGTIRDETRVTLGHIDKILRAAGCTPADVVKCMVILRDIKDFNEFNDEYARYFTGTRPARTTFQGVLWENIGVEIDCIAKVPDKA
jgi:2-iminobutanoate/2-iminopropanoate deaminase